MIWNISAGDWQGCLVPVYHVKAEDIASTPGPELVYMCGCPNGL